MTNENDMSLRCPNCGSRRMVQTRARSVSQGPFLRCLHCGWFKTTATKDAYAGYWQPLIDCLYPDETEL
jgi:uncharacterized Zn finger protein